MQGIQCMYCLHIWGMGKCFAYPDGIPARTMAGADVHDQVRKGQEGAAVFEVDPMFREQYDADQKLAAKAPQ